MDADTRSIPVAVSPSRVVKREHPPVTASQPVGGSRLPVRYGRDRGLALAIISSGVAILGTVLACVVALVSAALL